MHGEIITHLHFKTLNCSVYQMFMQFIIIPTLDGGSRMPNIPKSQSSLRYLYLNSYSLLTQKKIAFLKAKRNAPYLCNIPR